MALLLGWLLPGWQTGTDRSSIIPFKFLLFVTFHKTWTLFVLYLLTYSLTYLLTYYMEQSPSREANRFTATQEIPRI